MAGRQRLILIALGAVIAVVAFVAVEPDYEDESATSPAARSNTRNDDGSSPSEQATATELRPRYVRIRVRDGKPVGATKTIRGQKGRTIRFLVQSDAPHEVHLHGWDISKNVDPAGATRFRVRAEIDGIFELEDEDIGEEIASLGVEP